MMSAEVWVPLLAAGIGLLAGLGAGLVSTLLTQRWGSRERLAQWQREDSQRWQQDRQQTYARFLSALYDWDATLLSAWSTRKASAEDGTRTEPDFQRIDEFRRLPAPSSRWCSSWRRSRPGIWPRRLS